MKVEKEKESLRFELDKAAMNKEAESDCGAEAGASALESDHRRVRRGDRQAGEGARGRRQRSRHPRHPTHTQERRARAAVREDQDRGPSWRRARSSTRQLNELRVLKIKLGDLKRELGVPEALGGLHRRLEAEVP